VILLLLLVFVQGSDKLIQNINARQITTLNGVWNYIVDPYENGFYDYRYTPFDAYGDPSTSAGYFTNQMPVNPWDRVEYDFDLSERIKVPGDWNSQKEKLFYYEGTIWYKKSFDYSKTDSDNRVFVHFGAINYKADVYLNGHKLGTHKGGFTPFNFEVTDLLQDIDNFLIVKVDNTRKQDEVVDRIGFRSLSTRGADILLNGKSIFLRGISIHEEDPLRGGRAYSIDDARMLLGWANETPVSDARMKFLTNLRAFTLSQDDTRFISAALEVHGEGEGGLTRKISDPFAGLVDVLSFNQYVGWYDGLPDKCDQIHWAIDQNKPVIVSEFGGAALQGLRGHRLERWTEDYQGYLYEENLDMFERMPQFRGSTPWILTDFHSPRRVLPGIQDGWNRKGLISATGDKKMAFYIMQKYYRDKETTWDK